MENLKNVGIPSAVYYRKPMHRQTAFANLLTEATECPITEQICDVCLSLPLHPYLREEEIQLVCEILTSEL